MTLFCSILWKWSLWKKKKKCFPPICLIHDHFCRDDLTWQSNDLCETNNGIIYFKNSKDFPCRQFGHSIYPFETHTNTETESSEEKYYNHRNDNKAFLSQLSPDHRTNFRRFKALRHNKMSTEPQIVSVSWSRSCFLSVSNLSHCPIYITCHKNKASTAKTSDSAQTEDRSNERAAPTSRMKWKRRESKNVIAHIYKWWNFLLDFAFPTVFVARKQRNKEQEKDCMVRGWNGQHRLTNKRMRAVLSFFKLFSISALSFTHRSTQPLAYFALASFMTLDKRNCIIWIACCTLALVSLRFFLQLPLSPSFCFHFCFACFVLPFISTDLFAINSKRIFPWLFCLWSSVLHIRMSSIQRYFVEIASG